MTEPNQQCSLLGKIAAYTEIWTKDPSSTIFVSLAEAYRKLGMLDDAKNVVQLGLDKSPDCSPAYIVLARTLCQQGFYEDSAAAFEQALKFDPSSLAALVGFARLNILLGQEPRARELLLAARNLSPADSVINKLLLSLPVEQEPVPALQPEPPEDVAEPVEDDAADDSVANAAPLASLTLAELYLKQGLQKQALEMFRQLSAEKPNDLLLRRKIRDLEGQPAEVGSARSEALPLVVEPVEAAADIDSGELVAVSAAGELSSPDHEELAATVAEFSANEKILTTLEQWLETIQQRRGDV